MPGAENVCNVCFVYKTCTRVFMEIMAQLTGKKYYNAYHDTHNMHNHPFKRTHLI